VRPERRLVPRPSTGGMTARTARLGTFAWVRQTDGILRWRDRWRLLGQACLYGAATLPWELRRLFGLDRRKLAQLDPALLRPPDSKAAREAEELMDESVGAMVASHSRRTYAFAAALAGQDGLDYDREVVYVASLLHDLYWEHPDKPPRPHCFTLPAAEQALDLARTQKWQRSRQDVLADAITLHLNVWPPRDSVECYLVFVGARLDVAGYRHWDLHSETVKTIVERYPRFNLKRESAHGFDAQAAANPGSRVHFETRYLASKWFTRHAPFDE
jgi:hypothetical protein